MMLSRSLRSTGVRSQIRAMSTWEALCHNRTSAAQRQEFAGVNRTFEQRRVSAKAVSRDVPAIDFDHFRKTIKTPGVVDKIQAEYEAMTFADGTWKGEGEYVSKMDAQISKANKWSAQWEKEMQMAKVKLDQSLLEKKTIHSWSLEDWYANLPGSEEDLREEANRNDWLPSNEDEKLYAHDAKELTKMVKDGEAVTLPIDIEETQNDDLEKVKKMTAEFHKDFPSGYPTANPQ